MCTKEQIGGVKRVQENQTEEGGCAAIFVSYFQCTNINRTAESYGDMARKTEQKIRDTVKFSKARSERGISGSSRKQGTSRLVRDAMFLARLEIVQCR